MFPYETRPPTITCWVLRYNNLYLLAAPSKRPTFFFLKNISMPLEVRRENAQLELPVFRQAVTQRNSNATLIVAFLYRLAEASGAPRRLRGCDVAFLREMRVLDMRGPERLLQRARRGEHKGLEAWDGHGLQWQQLVRMALV